MPQLKKGNRTVNIPENQVEYMIKHGWERVIPSTPSAIAKPVIQAPVVTKTEEPVGDDGNEH